MRTLMRKDWRLASPLLLATGILFAVPFLLGGIFAAFFSQDAPKSTPEWLDAIAETFAFALIASVLTTPMFAAIMFARERRERTADFVATLPVTRKSVVLSKVIVAVAASLIPWAVSITAVAAIGMVLESLYPQAHIYRVPNDILSMAPFLSALGSGAFMAFGIAWLGSAILRSEVFAAAMSFLIVICLVTLRVMLEVRLGDGVHYVVSPWIAGTTMAGIGAVAFAIGTIVALRRASP